MVENFTPYDPAEALVDDEERAFFMAEAFATGNSAFIAKCLGIVARSKGMAEVAKKTGLSREQLYRTLSEDGNPTLKSFIAVMNAVGLDLATQASSQR